MRVLVAISFVLGALWIGGSALNLTDGGNTSEVVLLTGAGMTLWVAGLVARNRLAPGDRSVATPRAVGPHAATSAPPASGSARTNDSSTSTVAA